MPCLPDRAASLDGNLAAESVRQPSREERAQPRATRHRRRDTALHVGGRAFAGAILVEAEGVELARVGLLADKGAHGRDVEAEQATAHDSGGCNKVDVADLGRHFGHREDTRWSELPE